MPNAVSWVPLVPSPESMLSAAGICAGVNASSDGRKPPLPPPLKKVSIGTSMNTGPVRRLNAVRMHSAAWL